MSTRDEFEKWHREHSGISLAKHSDGQYVYAESEWRGYLAGRESMREDCFDAVGDEAARDAINAIPL